MMLEETLLEPFFEIVVSESIGDYQGDTLIVLKNREDYSWGEQDFLWGFLVSGYGSCSGCDAWEGADTGKEKFELLVAEVNSITWFATLAELQAYVSDKYARELEWYAHESEYKNFVDTVSKLTEGGDTDG